MRRESPNFDNFEFKSGDLVRVLQGCGKEGEIGLLLESFERKDTSTHYLLVNFSDGISEINSHWLESINEI